MDDELLASHVEAIHGVALEDFTAERDRRVKQLRADGHKEEAAALKARRKPTVPAWAVDQVARQAPDDVEALLRAAADLRTAQHRAASGRGAHGMREASRHLRDLVGELRERGGRILAEAGTRPDAHLDEVEQTIFAAAVDPEHHDTLRRGTFAAVLPGPGFGGLGFGLAALPDLPEPAPADDPDHADETADGLADAAEAERTAADERRATEEDRQAEAERQAEEERRAAEEDRQAEAERQAEEERRAEAARVLAARRRELTRRIDALEGALEKQAERVRRAQERADDLQARADAARADAEAARTDLEDYERDLAVAREELADLAAPDA
ncbi:hypothetical protein [Egicoccus sp. AB-alg6-2]|uniref:hypothetical protein n=1 Tax=Egicoccus sp. AB-alg6-2 TaxID=3242692 RepID=UPI00359D6D9B